MRTRNPLLVALSSRATEMHLRSRATSRSRHRIKRLPRFIDQEIIALDIDTAAGREVDIEIVRVPP